MSNFVIKIERAVVDPHYPNPVSGAPIPIADPVKELTYVPIAGTGPALRAVRVLPSFLDDIEHPGTLILTSLDVFILLPDPVSTLGASIVIGSISNFAAADLTARLAVLWTDVDLIVENAIRNPVADYTWNFKNYDTITP